MDIAILGTGNVGSTLGPAWARAGHTIVYGSRTPDSASVRELVELTDRSAGPGSAHAARALLPAQAAAQADTLLLATPWRVARDYLVGLGDLSGKVLLDATNAIQERPQGAASSAELLARALPGTHVVKAFNCIGTSGMADPHFAGQAASLFLAGDDPGAKGRAAGLARDLGFEVVDCGGLGAAEQLEHLARLWVHLAYGLEHGPDIAFTLLQR